LASPVVHVWYKNSPSGGIHQLLQLSTNEIDKILSFVKYVVVKEVSDEAKEEIKNKVISDFEATMKELDELYKAETENQKDKKKLAEAKKLYDENKASLELEMQRVRGLVADLKFGATILESDYRNIFSQFSKHVSFASGPEGILKMLQSIDVEKEIKRRVKEFPSIKSADQKKKAMSLIKLLINLYVSGVKPENMIIRKLPVIPPDIRPVVQLDG
jgi:DNA-directed RNA polymerase subunit beta'